MRVGVLALQGGVAEHLLAARGAALNLGLDCEIAEVRAKEDVPGLDALIIPGGESTAIHKLMEREGIFESVSGVRSIFGTCAGAVLLAKTVHGAAEGQKSLGLMDLEIERNAYGRQAESFERPLQTSIGNINAVFIRAPRIRSAGKSVSVLAQDGNEILACEQRIGKNYYLAACFHPELSTNLFHEHFLKNSIPSSPSSSSRLSPSRP